ncbi:glutaredoxin 2 [Marinobacterium lutimaris]|uniref:Glutaredoxin 2 n=1 Tax=Marinobacterium lutimaris TaxID=568106 RepID=A0A1H6D9Z2_9GAMM|nr:glutaredoxin 2 [Marinobacterium lutimaris]SEG82028.1 glutaredoxin 2 [Marinobacterium lutimaris]
MTRIYIYDHCPFCVRATMVAGYKKVPFQREVLLNDDEQTCFDLIGKKMLPVLQHGEQVIGESLDICQKLDEIGDAERVILPQTALAEQFSEAFSAAQPANWKLNFARVTRIGLPEFATDSARDYFRGKKEEMIGETFEEAFAKTDEYLPPVNQALANLPTLTLPSEREGRLSWDDVMIFPMLRSLTLVNGLEWPEPVRNYLNEVADLTRLDLYFDRAI